MQQIAKNIYRFDNQYFFGSPVDAYLIDLPDEIILFEIPDFNDKNVTFVKSFSKPVKAYLSHGSTGIADGDLWHSQMGVEVYLHKADDNYRWLAMKSAQLFESEVNTPQYSVIHTPGHSAGSITLHHFESKSLFVGDTLGAKDGNIMPFKESNHDDDLPKKIESIQKIATLDFENLLPFHYEMLIGGAAQKLRALL